MKRLVLVIIFIVLCVVCWTRFRVGKPQLFQAEPTAPVALTTPPPEPHRPARLPEENREPSQAEIAAKTDRTNFYSQLAQGSIPRLTREQIEPYLTRNGRSVEALLGALRASGDDTLLAEAKERFPHDPRVQFAAAFAAQSAEERRAWLEKFKQSDPDNALANYLVASEHSKAGLTDQALQEIHAATDKRGFDNYLLDFIQNAEEAYQASGYSSAEAKAIASVSALLPEQARLKELGVNLVELAKRYQQAGDQTSAQALLQMGVDLGHRLDQAAQPTVIQQLVGMAIERKALEAMDPNAPYGSSGQTVQQQLDALTARRNSYRELTSQSDRILASMPNEELANYFDRFRLFGDVAAMRWVINKSPQQ